MMLSRVLVRLHALVMHEERKRYRCRAALASALAGRADQRSTTPWASARRITSWVAAWPGLVARTFPIGGPPYR